MPDAGSGRAGADRVSADVLGRGSLYTLGTAAPVLAQVAVTPAVTRLLGATGGYGVVAAALVVVQVTMILASLGLPSVITRQALLGHGGIPGARSLFLRGGLLACCVIAVGAAATPLAVASVPAVSATGWLLALLAGGAFVVVENGQALLRAEDRAAAFVGLSTAATLGGPLVGLALLLAVDRTPEWYLVGLVGGYAMAAAVAVLATRGPRRHERGDTVAALRMGVPVLPHLVALYLATGALVLLAASRFGSAQAGRLQLALLVGIAPTVLVGALNNSWAPAIYRLDPSRRGAAVERTALDLTVLAALGSAGVTLLAPWLLRLLADERFDPAALTGAVGVISLGGMLSVGYLANVHLVFASGRTGGLAVATPAALAVGLVTAWFAGRGSVTGLAWGYPATYAALVLLVAALRRRLGGPTWSQAPLAIPLVVGGGLVAVGAALPVSGAWLALRLALAAALAILGAARLRRILRRPGQSSSQV